VAVVIDSELAGYAIASPHSSYKPYRGIAEFSVYIEERYRRNGFGRVALSELIRQCEAAGFTKMLSRIMAQNVASRVLCKALGFREVGIYERHARLDGEWRDVVIVEKILATATALKRAP